MFVDAIFLKDEKTPEDIDTMLRLHRNLVYNFLQQKNLVDNQTAESAGWEGLLNAINTYDYHMEVSFSSFAYSCIRNAVYVSIRQKKRVVDETSYDALVEINHDIPSNLDLCTSLIQDESCERIYKIIKELMLSLSPDTPKYKILATWLSGKFSYSVTQLANVIGTTKQNASRILQWIRVSIHAKLKEDEAKLMEK